MTPAELLALQRLPEIFEHTDALPATTRERPPLALVKTLFRDEIVELDVRKEEITRKLQAASGTSLNQKCASKEARKGSSLVLPKTVIHAAPANYALEPIATGENPITRLFTGEETLEAPSEITLFAWCVKIGANADVPSVSYFADALTGHIGVFTSYKDNSEPSTITFSLDEHKESEYLATVETTMDGFFELAEDEIKKIPQDTDRLFNTREIYEWSSDDIYSYRRDYLTILELLGASPPTHKTL